MSDATTPALRPPCAAPLQSGRVAAACGYPKSIRILRSRRTLRGGLSDLLTVVALVAGLLAMHGMTAHSTTGMPHMASASGTPSPMAHRSPALTSDPLRSQQQVTSPAGAVFSSSTPVPPALAVACLAVRSATGLLPLLLARRRYRSAPTVNDPAVTPAAASPLPPPTPSLSKLCIART